MKDREYNLLKKMSKKNRHLYKIGDIQFEEYIDNHQVITEQIKNSILLMEQVQILKLATLDDETCLQRFKQGIMMLKINFN